MRISESALLTAQRAKLDALEEAARASGDLELLRLWGTRQAGCGPC